MDNETVPVIRKFYGVANAIYSRVKCPSDVTVLILMETFCLTVPLLSYAYEALNYSKQH